LHKKEATNVGERRKRGRPRLEELGKLPTLVAST